MLHELILVKVSAEKVVEFIQKAGQVKGVVDADPVFGRFDAAVIIEEEDFEGLRRAAREVIAIGGVKSTETLAEAD